MSDVRCQERARREERGERRGFIHDWPVGYNLDWERSSKPLMDSLDKYNLLPFIISSGQINLGFLRGAILNGRTAPLCIATVLQAK